MPLKLIVGFLLITSLSGCGVYSFTGASVNPDIKTISVKNFNNVAGMGPSRLSQIFTEALRDFYLKNTNLTLVKDNGDLQLEGNIVGYSIAPVTIQNSNTPGTNQQISVGAQTRLTIRVKAKFTNTLDKTQNFEQEFSFYDDYEQNRTLNAVENDGVTLEKIYNQIILDIFNKSLANW